MRSEAMFFDDPPPMNVAVIVFGEALAHSLADIKNSAIGFSAVNVDVELTINHSLFY